MLRVLIFGFSVTEENGYIEKLRQRLDAQKIHITRRAIGGANFKCTPFLWNILEYEKYDLVLFEITTCLRFSEHNPAQYSELLHELLRQVHAVNSQIAFIHLYRSDINYEIDKLLPTALQFGIENNIQSLNLVPKILEIKRNGHLHKYFRDGTHTTQLGAEFYAAQIQSFFFNDRNDIPLNSKIEIHRDKIKSSRFYLIPADHLTSNNIVNQFTRGDIRLPCLEIKQNEKFYFQLPTETSLDSVIYIKGPLSGIFEIGLYGLGSFKILAFDQFSYYRRFSVWTSPTKGANRFSIQQLDKIPSIKLKKGENNQQPRLGEVCAFLVKNHALQNN